MNRLKHKSMDMEYEALKLRYELKSQFVSIGETSLDILISAFTEYNPFMPTEKISAWLDDLNNQTLFKVKEIPLKDVTGWYYDESQNMRHVSGKFFSIEGIHVKTNVGNTKEWKQPIIYQPEIGILGILCQKHNGILYFLMQAKIEPGNVNKIQVSPTVQATKSNYTQVHKGNLPPYLEHFLDAQNKKIIVDQLQSEQGSRFFKKRNRNIILELPGDAEIDVLDNFCWLTLGQIKKMMKNDNIINMNTRTVLSCTQMKAMKSKTEIISNSPLTRDDYFLTEFKTGILKSILDEKESLNSVEEIISWFTDLKTKVTLEVERCHMKEVETWNCSDERISHEKNKYFEIIGIDTEIGNREISSWCQPILRQLEEGIVGFIIKEINSVYHLLVQAKAESGNFDILEMAPTVQCITGSYKNPEYDVEYLDYFTQKKGIIHYDTILSEEGGRFYQEQNRYIVIEVGDEFPVHINNGRFIWMTFKQVKEFIKFNNYFNVEARSLISCISQI